MRVWANFHVPNLRYHYKNKKISSCVFSDISNLAHRNLPKLAQIIRLIFILLSGEFQENTYIRIYRYMPWYHFKPHIWRYFLVFLVISQIWHIEIRLNWQRLSVLKLSYYLESFKKIRILGSTDIYALVPLQTTYLEIFSCVCSDISNLAHRN